MASGKVMNLDSTIGFGCGGNGSETHSRPAGFHTLNRIGNEAAHRHACSKWRALNEQ
jgi:hypothetical protein